jgi:DHA1 family tetracycline resistance protein-like MFS transporter
MSDAENRNEGAAALSAANEPPKGALGIIFLIVLIDLMGFGIIIPLLPFYVPGYRENPLKVTLLFSAFSMCQFVGAPILGMLSDRFGRRPVLIISQFGSAAGYLLLGVATTLGMRGSISNELMLTLVYTSRVIDGFTGGNISTAQAYVSDVTTKENRAKGMGVLGAAFGIGFCLGPFLGGTLGHFDKAWPAYVACALCAVAATLTYLKLPESVRHGETEVTAWLHPARFAPVLRKPVLVQLLAISFFTMAAFVMMESTIGIYLDRRETFGFDARQVGYFFGFLGVVIIIVQGRLIGPLTKRFGEWPLAITGTLLVALGMAGFAATSWWPLLALLCVAGAINATGRSLQQPTVSSLLSKFSDPREQGVVFGLYHGLGSLARVVGPLVAGLVYTWQRHTGAFITAGCVAIVMALWTLVLRQPTPDEGATLKEALGEAAIEAA